MTGSGPIIIVEDDIDDQELFKDAIESNGINNEIKFFDSGTDALHYLKTTTDKPFLILTDVNLPKMDGIELRAEVCKDEYLRKKSIPYIFLSTSEDKFAINKAYEMNVQGYFQKPNSFSGLQILLKQIIDYWSICKHPNNT